MIARKADTFGTWLPDQMYKVFGDSSSCSRPSRLSLSENAGHVHASSMAKAAHFAIEFCQNETGRIVLLRDLVPMLSRHAEWGATNSPRRITCRRTAAAMPALMGKKGKSRR